MTRRCLSLDIASFRFSAFGHENRFSRFIGVIYLVAQLFEYQTFGATTLTT